jgi:tRNA (guanine37-N1)-methyltransferase
MGEHSNHVDGPGNPGDGTPNDAPGAPAGTVPMRIDIVTLFPAMFTGPFDTSIVGRARAAGLVDIQVHNLRDWATDRHRTTDDYAFGGGGGMVMKPEPLFRAVEALLGLPPRTAVAAPPLPCPVVLMTPQGERFDHGLARSLAAHDRLVILCGHYEGFDERVRDHLATHEVSLGDFVLTGGELPAMVVTDAVARLRPGVVGLETGTHTDSFAAGLLEHPHYTRPADFRGWSVPEVLVSGHHGAVDTWRHREALVRTARRRPDLLAGLDLTDQERRWLQDARLLVDADAAGDP